MWLHCLRILVFGLLQVQIQLNNGVCLEILFQWFGCTVTIHLDRQLMDSGCRSLASERHGHWYSKAIERLASAAILPIRFASSIMS